MNRLEGRLSLHTLGIATKPTGQRVAPRTLCDLNIFQSQPITEPILGMNFYSDNLN